MDLIKTAILLFSAPFILVSGYLGYSLEKPLESPNLASEATFGATRVGVRQGGTATTVPPGYSQLLLGNLTGGYDLVSLTEGSNITITTTTNSLTITSTGGGCSPIAYNIWRKCQV